MKKKLRILIATVFALALMACGSVTAFAAESYDTIDEAIAAFGSGTENMVIDGVGYKYCGNIEDNVVMGGSVNISEESVIYKAGDGAVLVDIDNAKITLYNATADCRMLYDLSDDTIIELVGTNIINNLNGDCGFYNAGKAKLKVTGDGELTINAPIGILANGLAMLTDDCTGELNFSMVNIDTIGETVDAYINCYGNCILPNLPTASDAARLVIGQNGANTTYISIDDGAVVTIPSGFTVDFMNTTNSLSELINYLSVAPSGKIKLDGEILLPYIGVADSGAMAVVQNVAELFNITGTGNIKALKSGDSVYTYNLETAANEAAKAKFAKLSTTVTLTRYKKAAKVSWKKVSGAKGYKIYRSTKKTKGFKLVKTIKSSSTTSYKNTKLKARKTYYYKVRAYTVIGGKTVYSKYSTVKKVKTK